MGIEKGADGVNLEGSNSDFGYVEILHGVVD